PILDNMKLISERGIDTILRCPVIPGLNDRDDHFRAISETAMNHRSIIEVNLMAYHNMGHSKAEEIGIKVPDLNIETVKKEKKEEWIENIRSWGCSVKIK
ncbi:MAG: hypothetical protein B6241_03515, partial [Spirochaetaceae bacterium 4572_59]